MSGPLPADQIVANADPELREKAMRITKIMVEHAFPSSEQAERHLSRVQLQAYLVTAFEYGAVWESRR